ncbi:hypothetical protein ERJ75_000330000 [Trypanosoma vivax]|uniref:Uncharacterized protein n=1 Tax=Trypanosoma vivax (strain Y486) TaxID=1055687 RepID=G0UAH3_TRYVY|nr:hypothetical protein TRVL_01193 [Trypanosoma vivax]KAH8617977.1 hypothetical protein ERJ75_000330000 [Trypanosoma vivax]CCC52806.1 conserved hypothetical protein [Trypanosoma vivax Y486]
MWCGRRSFTSAGALSPHLAPADSPGGGETADLGAADAWDRFIVPADYKNFFLDPSDRPPYPNGDDWETVYRRKLESFMGLSGNGLMLVHGSEHAPSTRMRDDDRDTCHSPLLTTVGHMLDSSESAVALSPSYHQQLVHEHEHDHDHNDADSTQAWYDQRKTSYLHPSSPARSCFNGLLLNQSVNFSANSGKFSSSGAAALGAETRDGCHTPLLHSRDGGSGTAMHVSGGGCVSANRTPYQERAYSPVTPHDSTNTPRAYPQMGDTHWMSPMTNHRTPLHGSRVGDATRSVSFTPRVASVACKASAFSSASPPRLRTPVVHEGDLSSPAPSGQVSSVGVSMKGSPLLRRSVLYSQHSTPRRQAKTWERAFKADGLSFYDAQRNPSFNTLCWGYVGIVVALHPSVYLWRGPNERQELYNTHGTHAVVTSVTSSRSPTEVGDVYIAFALSSGSIVVDRYHVCDCAINNGEAPATLDGTLCRREGRIVLEDHSRHVSTLQVVEHMLYAGSMSGLLTLHNLRDCFAAQQAPRDHGARTQSYSRCTALNCVRIGAPIYRLEVSPDGERIAVGTNDSLFVLQSNSLASDEEMKRRTILTKATQPVRAFCWWAFPYNSHASSSVDSSRGSGNTGVNSSNSRSAFFQTMLIYGVEADGSFLYVYSVGERRNKAMYRLQGPVLGIVSSGSSNEILVSINPHSADRTRIDRSNTESDILIDGSAVFNDDNGHGALAVSADDWPHSYDSMSDEGEISSVVYVDRHQPISTHGAVASNSSMVGGHRESSFTPLRRRQTFVTEAVLRRPPLPVPPHTGGGKMCLLHLFQLKDKGETLEWQSGYPGLPAGSLFMALSPDDTLLVTAAPDMTLRLWRPLQVRVVSHSGPCQFR